MYRITPVVINKIILLILFMTPIFTFLELMALLTSSQLITTSATALITPISVKILKDLVIFLIRSLAFIFILKRARITYSSFLMGFFVILIITISLFKYSDIYMLISGLRWFMPFILTVFLIEFVTKKLLKDVAKVMAYLFALSFILQIYELFTLGGYYGEERFGVLARRTTGFYIFPTALGFFIIMSFFSNYFYGSGSLRKFVIYATPIAIIMSYSKTAIISYLVIILIIKFYKDIVPLSLLIITTMSVYFSILYVYVESAITVSLFSRLETLAYNFTHSGLWAGQFGLSSITYDLIKEVFDLDLPQGMGADSFIGAVSVNLGLLGFFILILLYLFLIIVSYKSKNIDFFIFLIIYGLFSMTIPFTELFPINLLFSIFLAYYLKKGRRHGEI